MTEKPETRTPADGHTTALLEQALAKYQAGQLPEAEAAYNAILADHPDHPDALHLLGILCHQKGEAGHALELISRAVAIDGANPRYRNNLGNVLMALSRLSEASEHYRRAVEFAPDQAMYQYNLGNVLKELNRPSEAIRHYRKALALKSDFPEALTNLGNAMRYQGRIQEAMEQYRRALKVKPGHASAMSNMLFVMDYCGDLESAAIFAAHREWAKTSAQAVPGRVLSHDNEPTPERRLRIGYVSADFCQHPVAHLIAPVITGHDRDGFEVFCYSGVKTEDTLTQHLRDDADHWRDVLKLGNDQMARLIQADAIDILVDLSGHTAGNRLQVFAQKPAPVQVTYLGYGNTTGLEEMDYRIIDHFTDPEGMTDPYYSENLMRLPGCFLCWRPPAAPAAVANLPAAAAGHVTFGSFNDLAKVNDGLVTLWSKILDRVPGSRLVLKAGALADGETRGRIEKMFQDNGIAPGRVELMGRTPTYSEHMEIQNRIDIGLDSFPLNGTVTTLEALWMGTPVITLCGDRHASRVGVSLLWNIGLEELIAEDGDDYVDKAVDLAEDLSRLKTLRSDLPGRFRASGLVDVAGFTSDLEAAYRGMWRRWCAGAPAARD